MAQTKVPGKRVDTIDTKAVGQIVEIDIATLSNCLLKWLGETGRDAPVRAPR